MEFHFSARSLAAGRNGGAAAVSAYIAGRTTYNGIRLNSPHGPGEVAFGGLELPPGAHFLNAEVMWNAADLAERRKDGSYQMRGGDRRPIKDGQVRRVGTPRIATHTDMALPWGTSETQSRRIVKHICDYLIANHQVGVQWSVHTKNGQIDHVHFLWSSRTLSDKGFSGKARTLNSIACRNAKKDDCRNPMRLLRHYAAKVIDEVTGVFWDPRSFEERQIDLVPEPKLDRRRLREEKRRAVKSTKKAGGEPEPSEIEQLLARFRGAKERERPRAMNRTRKLGRIRPRIAEAKAERREQDYRRFVRSWRSARRNATELGGRLSEAQAEAVRRTEEALAQASRDEAEVAVQETIRVQRETESERIKRQTEEAVAAARTRTAAERKRQLEEVAQMYGDSQTHAETLRADGYASLPGAARVGTPASAAPGSAGSMRPETTVCGPSPASQGLTPAPAPVPVREPVQRQAIAGSVKSSVATATPPAGNPEPVARFEPPVAGPAKNPAAPPVNSKAKTPVPDNSKPEVGIEATSQKNPGTLIEANRTASGKPQNPTTESLAGAPSSGRPARGAAVPIAPVAKTQAEPGARTEPKNASRAEASSRLQSEPKQEAALAGPARAVPAQPDRGSGQGQASVHSGNIPAQVPPARAQPEKTPAAPLESISAALEVPDLSIGKQQPEKAQITIGKPLSSVASTPIEPITISGGKRKEKKSGRGKARDDGLGW